MKYFITVFLALWALASPAQKIRVDLPHFAGKGYVWFCCHGDKQDTIAQGALNAKGQAVLTVPPLIMVGRGCRISCLPMVAVWRLFLIVR